MMRLVMMWRVMLWLALIPCCFSAHADSLDDLLDDYQRYGLPLPPRGAELVVIQRRECIVNGKQQYSRVLSFVESTDTDRRKYWNGCRSYPLSHESTITTTDASAELVGVTVPDELRHVCTPGFPTFADLALALQCKSRGHDELARALLKQNRAANMEDPFGNYAVRPQDDRRALAMLAWNYWCNEFAISRDDRRPIVQRLITLRDSNLGLSTDSHRSIVDDMERTLTVARSEPDTMEAVVDSLVELGVERGWRGQGFARISHAGEAHKSKSRDGFSSRASRSSTRSPGSSLNT